MYKIMAYCNDKDSEYFDELDGTYDTFNDACLMAFRCAISETQSLMETANGLEWFEVCEYFEITDTYYTPKLETIDYFEVAVLRYDKAPWDRINDCDISIVTGYKIIQII